jgi:MFS family permease
MALVTDIAAPARRGVAMAGFNVAGSIGFLAGIVGGGTLAARRGFQTAFLAVGFAEVVIAVVAFPLLLRLAGPILGPPGVDSADEHID